MSQEPHYTRKMPRPRLGPERGHTLCASLRNRKPCQEFTRATVHWNLHVKCRRPNELTTQTPFCASLRSRNACQDLTRAILCGNLQEKCRAPQWAPWSSTGLYSYRKNPSVWTHCMGQMLKIKNILDLCWFRLRNTLDRSTQVIPRCPEQRPGGLS